MVYTVTFFFVRTWSLANNLKLKYREPRKKTSWEIRTLGKLKNKIQTEYLVNILSRAWETQGSWIWITWSVRKVGKRGMRYSWFCPWTFPQHVQLILLVFQIKSWFTVYGIDIIWVSLSLFSRNQSDFVFQVVSSPKPPLNNHQWICWVVPSKLLQHIWYRNHSAIENCKLKETCQPGCPAHQLLPPAWCGLWASKGWVLSSSWGVNTGLDNFLEGSP